MSSQVRRPLPGKLPPAVARRRRLIALGSIALVAMLAIVAIALANRVPESASTAPITSVIKVGDRAPDFAVSSTGGPFALAAASASAPTLVEVFATWCPHCQREAPVLSTLADRYRGRVNFIGVSGSPYGVDGSSPETQADVVSWAQKFGARYPVAFDPNLDVAHKYISGGFPTVVLVSKGGRVSAIRSGEMPPADLAAGIDALLAGKKPNPKLGLK